jgi:signal transduction histidine kinase
MSHEFRTPLNAILGYSEMLCDGIIGPVTDQQRERLTRIMLNAQHLEDMVKEILAATQGDVVDTVLEYRTVELGALVRQVGASIEALAESKGLALDIEIPDGPVSIVTDPTKVRHILVNLLGNAVRYTDEGQLWLRARIDGETIVFEIEDTGIGIAPEHLEQVFERFWQVDQGDKRIRGGTGLGLMVVRELAGALGGNVEVESQLGEGSLFRIRLPRDSTHHRGSGD